MVDAVFLPSLNLFFPNIYLLRIHPLTTPKHNQLTFKSFFSFFLWFQHHHLPFQELGVSTVSKQVKSKVTPALGFGGFLNFTFKEESQEVWGQGRGLR